MFAIEIAEEAVLYAAAHTALYLAAGLFPLSIPRFLSGGRIYIFFRSFIHCFFNMQGTTYKLSKSRGKWAKLVRKYGGASVTGASPAKYSTRT